ncbi:UgpB ABC-type sugar transport system, periplasmic component [Candidatus Nanopelagicaceae bacterium]
MKTKGHKAFASLRAGVVATVAAALVITPLAVSNAADAPTFGKVCSTEGVSTGQKTTSLICQQNSAGKLTWQRVRLGGSNAQPVASLTPPKGSIEFHHWRSEDKVYLQGIIDDFQTKYPGTKITQVITDSTNYQNLELSKVSVNPKAALVTIFRGQQFTDFAKANMMVDLSNERFVKQNVIQSALTPGILNGKVYAVPYQSLFNNPIYNTEMFAKNGWKTPTNWTQLLAFCKTSKAKGIIPFAWPAATKGNAGQIMNAMMMNSDSSIEAITKHVNDIQAGKESVSDAWFKGIATKYAQMNDAGCFPDNVVAYTDVAAQADFAAGKAAIYPTGTFGMGAIKALNPSMAGKMGIFGMIVVDSKPIYEGITNNTFMFSINPKANSTDQKIARAFMSYLLTAPVAQKYAVGSSQHVSVINVDYAENIDLLNTSVIMGKKLVLAPRFLFTNGAVATPVELALMAIGSGKDVTATLADAAKQIKTALGA